MNLYLHSESGELYVFMLCYISSFVFQVVPINLKVSS